MGLDVLCWVLVVVERRRSGHVSSCMYQNELTI